MTEAGAKLIGSILTGIRVSEAFLEVLRNFGGICEKSLRAAKNSCSTATMGARHCGITKDCNELTKVEIILSRERLAVGENQSPPRDADRASAATILPSPNTPWRFGLVKSSSACRLSHLLSKISDADCIDPIEFHDPRHIARDRAKRQRCGFLRDEPLFRERGFALALVIGVSLVISLLQGVAGPDPLRPTSLSLVAP